MNIYSSTTTTTQKMGLMWEFRPSIRDSPSWWGSSSCSPDRLAGEEGHLIRKSRQCSKGLSIKQNELSILLLGIFLSAALRPRFLWCHFNKYLYTHTQQALAYVAQIIGCPPSHAPKGRQFDSQPFDRYTFQFNLPHFHSLPQLWSQGHFPIGILHTKLYLRVYFLENPTCNSWC